MTKTTLPETGTITDVQFLFNEEEQDLFAYFPHEDYDRNGMFKSSYSHVGQHSACSPQYAKESRKATKAEYQDLKTELEGLGYVLNIIE